jgi:hypothetical protein
LYIRIAFGVPLRSAEIIPANLLRIMPAEGNDQEFLRTSRVRKPSRYEKINLLIRVFSGDIDSP